MTNPNFTLTSISISGAPPIEFAFKGDTCTAELEGAVLYVENANDRGADMRLTNAAGEVLADIKVNERAHRNATENVMDIGSALLWSHWQYLQATASMKADEISGVVTSADLLSDEDTSDVVLRLERTNNVLTIIQAHDGELERLIATALVFSPRRAVRVLRALSKDFWDLWRRQDARLVYDEGEDTMSIPLHTSLGRVALVPVANLEEHTLQVIEHVPVADAATVVPVDEEGVGTPG